MEKRGAIGARREGIVTLGKYISIVPLYCRTKHFFDRTHSIIKNQN